MGPRHRRLDDMDEPTTPSKRLRRTSVSLVEKVLESSTTSSRVDENSTRSPSGVVEDDLCPVCRRLLYKPVVTICHHHLCEACMTQWAEVSASSQMVMLDVEETITEPVSNAAMDLEVNCPMCRTQTSATVDHKRAKVLSRKYADEYEERKREDDAEIEAANQGNASSVQALTVHIGNRHRLLPDHSVNHGEEHSCTFFVKPSRTDIIEEVQVQLPTIFRPSRIIRTRPPFEIERAVNGSFTIYAHIILKAGYSWLSSDAVDSPDGAVNGMLPLEWTLDFTGHGGKGSMGRIRMKVMKEGAHTADSQGQDQEDKELRRDRNAWERMVREYQRDGLWDPGDSDDD